MTLAETLRDAEARLHAEDIADARLEAEVLLCHALGFGRERLFARLREPLPAEVQRTFQALLLRRAAHEPTAYVVGSKEFYGLELACTPAALIPRPETELLVEHAIAWLRREDQGTRKEERGSPWRRTVVDVGTGNGAIAVAIAASVTHARVVAIDTSPAALELARRNARAHGVDDRIAFVRSSMLASVRGVFDLIVANLPYVPAHLYEKLAPEIRDHEPRGALHAGRRGTALIEALLAQAPAHLRPDGLLLAEHAWNQGRRLREAAQRAFPTATVETKRDLAGRERMLVVRAS